MTAERWLPVVGWEDCYEVSDLGRVRRTFKDNKASLGIMRGSVDEHGYPRVDLRRNDRRRNARVHRLVAEAFLGPTPAGQEVRHLNGDPSDARLVNLRYGTHAENMRDMVEHGRSALSRTHCPAGHPYVGKNVWIDGRGARNCRKCCTARTVAWERRDRALKRARGEDHWHNVRQWGRANGFKVADTGRLSHALIDAYALATERT